MKKIERLQNIIYLLSQNNRLSATALAGLLEVSPRTIYRDMDALSQMKVPIIAYEGLEGGYELEQSYFFQSVQLTDKELMMMILLLEMGYQLNTTDFDDSLVTLKHKLLNAAGKQPNINEVLHHITAEVQNIYPEKIKKGVFITIIHALQKKQMVSIDYFTPLKESWLTREIAPLHLYYSEGCWYIDAYCNVRKAKRTFRLDRIRLCELLKERIPLQYFETYQANKYNDPTLEIRMQMDKGLYQLVKDDVIMKDSQILEESQLWVMVCTKVVRIEHIVMFAYRNVERVTVVSPLSVIEQIQNKIKIMQEKYIKP